MTHESPARDAVELVARKLCEQVGGDPDALATEPHDCWEGLLWTQFTKEAEEIIALTTPSPSSEYARGIEDAAKVADDNRTDDDSMWDRAAVAMASAIRALSPTAVDARGAVQEGWNADRTAVTLPAWCAADILRFCNATIAGREALIPIGSINWLRPDLSPTPAHPQEGVVPDGWKPLDSAPKDGTRFLGLTKFGPEMVKWCDGSSADNYGPHAGWIGVEQDSACLPANYRRDKAQQQPTHWMPLPAAPKEAK